MSVPRAEISAHITHLHTELTSYGRVAYVFCVTVARDDVLHDEPDENVVDRDVPKDISRLQLRLTKHDKARFSYCQQCQNGRLQ